MSDPIHVFIKIGARRFCYRFFTDGSFHLAEYVGTKDGGDRLHYWTGGKVPPGLDLVSRRQVVTWCAQELRALVGLSNVT